MIKNYSIKNLHSFSMNVKAEKIFKIFNINDLYEIYKKHYNKKLNLIIIGNGTNCIFLENFNGFVIINKILGIKIYKDKNFWKLHVNSGESWHNLVKFTLKNNIFGLENLAMIPGKIGAAPIYNIGAYGSEFKNFCSYVNVLNIKNNKIIKFNKKQCKFSYRNSIFQHINLKNYLISSIGLDIPIIWKPNICHNIFNNNNFTKKNVTAKKIFNFICKIRKNNIPNYNIFSNSGSIFKNPIINNEIINKFKNKYKSIPYINISKNKIIISAGWLIEKCGFKKFRIGNLLISNKNSLIIINLGKSTGNDLKFLIKLIYNEVINKFNIKLKLEVDLISKYSRLKIKDLIY